MCDFYALGLVDSVGMHAMCHCTFTLSCVLSLESLGNSISTFEQIHTSYLLLDFNGLVALWDFTGLVLVLVLLVYFKRWFYMD